MARGGGNWVRAPGGGVVASFSDNDPTVDCGALEVFLLAKTRSEAVKRARRLGMHGLTLKDKGAEIFDDEVEALLSSGQDMLWRRDSDPERWRTIDEWPLKRE